jgi:hypothetical protein
MVSNQSNIEDPEKQGDSGDINIVVPTAEVMKFAPHEMVAYRARRRRLQLRAAGFSPLPLEGKAPKMMTGWQTKFDVTTEEIRLWGKSYPYAHNTGMLTKFTPAVDIDLMHPEAAEAIEALAREHFEERGDILVRVGKAPKRAILLRTDEPFDKIARSFEWPQGKGQIEVLANGQQVVAFGIHPETKQPYRWHGGEPGAVKREDLPYVRQSDIEKFLDAARALLIEQFGFTDKGGTQPKTDDDQNAPHDPADWGELTTCILRGEHPLHDSIARLAASLVAHGMTDRAAIDKLRSLMTASIAAKDARWRDYYNDIPRAVRTAREKFERKENDAKPLPPLLHAYSPRPFSEIPRRQWLHAGHYIRRLVVMTVAPGGWGKTTLILCNAVEMCLALGLLGPAPVGGPLRVAYWNAEDEEEEIERRLAAICIRYDIDPERLRGQLFLGSKITGGRRLAELGKNGKVIFDEPIINQVTQFIGDNRIDCTMFDPLIAFHTVPEGDNIGMEQVIKQGFEPIAIKTNSCVELSQHTRKPGQGQYNEITADDSRGGSSIVNAARSVRILNRMSKEDAQLPKITNEARRLYLRLNRDKVNYTPPEKAMWVHLESVDLPNGDNVQVAAAWDYPQPFDNITVHDMHWMRDEVRRNSYRADSRSGEWVGYALAARLQLDIGTDADRTPSQKGDRMRVNAILKGWFDNGVLAKEKRRDEEARKEFDYVVVGPWSDTNDDA